MEKNIIEHTSLKHALRVLKYNITRNKNKNMDVRWFYETDLEENQRVDLFRYGNNLKIRDKENNLIGVMEVENYIFFPE